MTPNMQDDPCDDHCRVTVLSGIHMVWGNDWSIQSDHIIRRYNSTILDQVQ